MLLRSLLLVSSFAALGAAQSPVPTAAAAEPATTVLQVPPGLHRCAGELVGLGPDYKVHFGAGGITFVPVLGAAAPVDRPLGLQVTHCGRGELQPVGAATSIAQELAVDYRRPQLTERITLRQDGAKQSFWFDALPPGSGDLVVRVAVTLPPDTVVTAAADGVHFGDERSGGVSVGTVLGIDAAGRRRAGSLRWDGAALEFVLPAGFVADAALPLELDPLLSTISVIGNPAFDERDPQAAYLGIPADQYLVMWRRVISASNRDLVGQRLNGTGAPVGNVVVLELSAADTGSVSVAQLQGSFAAFLVAWEQSGDLWLGRVSTTGVINQVPVITDSNVKRAPVLAGGLDIAGRIGLFWHDLTANQILGTQIDLANLQAQAPVLLASGSFTVQVADPAVSISNPDPVALLTWTSTSTVTGGRAVRGRLVGKDAVPLGTAFTIAGGGTSEAFAADSAGDGDAFVVAYETQGITGPGLACVSLRRAGAVVELGPVRSLVPLGTGTGAPRVAWFGGSAVVSWTVPNGALHDVRITSVDPFTGADCEGQLSVDVASNDIDAAIVAEFGQGVSNTDGAVVWSAVAGGSGGIRFRRFTAVDGTQQNLAGACGVGGRSYATAARVGNQGFGLQLVGGPPAALSFALVATQELIGGFACGTCEVWPDFTQGVIEFTGTTSAAGCARYLLPIPNQPSLVGFDLLGQFVFTGSDCLGSFQLSDALRVQLQ